MADDRMKKDDLHKNMGGAGQEKDKHGQQTPGRKQQDDMSTGQRGAGQKSEPGHMKDDFGKSEKSGTGQQGGRQGGQNR
jgi:hypothetical protein